MVAVLKNKLFFLLNIVQNVKHKDLESCLSKTCLFYSITLQRWTWKQLIDTGMINKFPEISELTTLTTRSRNIVNKAFIDTMTLPWYRYVIHRHRCTCQPPPFGVAPITAKRDDITVKVTKT